ncbi:MAG: hypothetical protein AAF637_21325 [Pseudomonadota bacterium]
MHNRRRGCVGGLALLAAAVIASTTSAQERPDLIGSWTGQYRAAVHQGGNFEVGEETTTLVIESQDGEFFTGYAQWVMDAETTTSDIGEEEVTGGRDPFIGVISHDGEEIHMAEVDDTGVYRGKLLDEDRLMLTYVEADLAQAVLLSTVFTRQR